MEAMPVLRGLSLGLACLFGAGMACWCAEMRRASVLGARRASQLEGFGAFGAKESVLRWRVRQGVLPLMPLCRRLLRLRGCRLVAAAVASEFRDRGLAAGDEACLSWVASALLAAAAAAFMATGSAPACAAVVACLGICVLQGAKAREETRRDRLRESVPETLQSLAGCFQSGLTVAQAFERQASDLPGPIGSLFGEAASRIQVGEGVHGALDHLRKASSLPELSFVAVALDVQHQTGGSIRAILESSSAVVEEQLELKRSLRVQTAQARLSARVVTVLPFVLIALFSMVSEGFLEPFFTSPAGLALLVMALLLQMAGICCVRRILAVDLT